MLHTQGVVFNQLTDTLNFLRCMTIWNWTRLIGGSPPIKGHKFELDCAPLSLSMQRELGMHDLKV